MLETQDRKRTTVRVSYHAWQRYCQRVDPIEYDELQQMVSIEVTLSRYRHNKRLCKLAEVWWRYAWKSGHITLITCYGPMPYDLIDALDWCRRRKDRVNIT
jgi:hypothetical protein